MKKKYKILVAVFAVLFVISLSLNIKTFVEANGSTYRLVTDKNTRVEYLQTENYSYPLISAESVNAGLFSYETYDRMNYVSLYTGDYVPEDQMDTVSSGHYGDDVFSTFDYGSKQLNDSEKVYFYINWEEQISSIYARQGFTMPEVTAENVEYFMWYDPDKDDNVVVDDRNEIDKLFSDPEKYCAENNFEDFDLKYFNYDFTEYFYAPGRLQHFIEAYA